MKKELGESGLVARYDPALYDARYFRRGKKHRLYTIVPALTRCLVAGLGPFTSALDLGAGAGCYSLALTRLGTETWAVELSEHAPVFFLDDVHTLRHDLQRPLDLERVFDLVLCIEVAEHLPESAADTLCDTIAHHCGRLVVFTAAPPGQGGTGHINCQPPRYWRTKMEARGLQYLPSRTKQIRRVWADTLRGKFKYLTRNLALFGKSTEGNNVSHTRR